MSFNSSLNQYRCIDGDDQDKTQDCERVNQQQMESKRQRCADCILDSKLKGYIDAASSSKLKGYIVQENRKIEIKDFGFIHIILRSHHIMVIIIQFHDINKTFIYFHRYFLFCEGKRYTIYTIFSLEKTLYLHCL